MLKILLLLITLTLSTNAKAELNSQNFGYKSCNHHKFTVFFAKIYDIYLCNEEARYLYPEEIFKDNFSLIIQYNMKFSKEELSDSSIEEMNRYYSLSKEDQNIYYNKLVSIFQNVEKGDVIEAKYNKKGTIHFYRNKVLTGKIDDAKFSRIFLDVWLYKDNKYKEMTKDLFAKR
jgi:hypothetical protein